MKNEKGISLISLLLIIVIILCIVLFINIFNKNNSNNDVQKNSTTNNNSTTVPILHLNEEASILDSDGGEASITITGIREMTERNHYADENYPQVFLIDYTYKNISSKNSIYFSNSNFKIIDEKGEVGGTYPNSYIRPERIIAGTTCNAQMVFGVNNRSNKITLQFWGSSFWDNQPVLMFELDV